MRYMMNCGLKTIPSPATHSTGGIHNNGGTFTSGKAGKTEEGSWSRRNMPRILQENMGSDKIRPTRSNEKMYREGIISDQQNRGIPGCLPKKPDPTRTEDYRPLTLMNTDYKPFARIIANRLRPWLAGILQPSQHCGLPGNTVFGAVATVRDAVVYVEATGIPLCVLTIDFKEAFDKISHSYLHALLRQHGFSDRFQQRIRNII